MINNKQNLMDDILDAISKGLKESLNIEEQIHPYNGVLTDIRDYESVFHSPNFELYKLNEKYHEVCISQQILNNIIKIIKDNKNNLGKDIYTNYCFKIYKVNNHKTYKIYKSININKDHPIYVNLYSNKSNVYGKTENRIISNDINLDNDHIRIYINVYYINMEKFIYSVLKHELTHVVEMYSAKKFNNINNLKNTIGIDKDNDIMLDINPLAKNMLNRMVYLFSNTEHNAHINGLAEFINKLSPTEIKKYTKYIQHENDDENIKVINNINNPIYNFMRNYDDLDILTNYQEFEDYMFDLKSYLENNDLLPIFYLGYLLQKHHLIYNKTQINWDFIKNYMDKKYKNYSKYHNIAVQIVSFYDYKIKQYREDIYKIIYKKFKEKKII